MLKLFVDQCLWNFGSMVSACKGANYLYSILIPCIFLPYIIHLFHKLFHISRYLVHTYSLLSFNGSQWEPRSSIGIDHSSWGPTQIYISTRVYWKKDDKGLTLPEIHHRPRKPTRTELKHGVPLEKHGKCLATEGIEVQKSFSKKIEL